MLGEPSSVTRDVTERTSDQLQYPGNYVTVYVNICSFILDVYYIVVHYIVT